ncbi:MAG: UDP-N-acetylmuramoyl-L-alanyl-D-glutamate--2,6-diaminopimelate ligase [Ruminococcaceae bacterium]|nr:UDP-N-acetylmuramoyl-L-alanyl-D-glutamate--2,6-diaminopimelate ligase [Oscillospiraceae bacterium]
MKLKEILANIDVKNEYSDKEVINVTSDSRLVEEGFLYVCIKGASFDGHSVAEKMLEKGAAAVVCERDLGLENQIIVDDTRAVYSPICANFFGNPANSLKLIGLTGTNGKTTTTFIIKQILENLGKKVGLIGTVQNMVGSEIYPAHYTTPDPYELQSLFRKMVDAGCEYCVMEVSSQALAQGRVAGIHFELAAFTNLTQDHLDYHKTWENYFGSKRILFENCDIAITNIDDKNGLRIVEGLPCKVKTYSVDNNNSDFTARNVCFSSDGVKYELVTDRIGRVQCPIPGRFSVYNSLCAVSVAIALGFDFEDVLRAVAKCSGVKGRIEVVPTETDYTVIIDYAHSPDGLENIISSLREISKGRIVTLFGCGGDRDRTKRPLMGEIAARLSDFCVVTSDNPRSEKPADIINDILEGMKNTKTPYKVIENRKEAIEWALENARENDIILLAGKGHETYQILNDGTIHFDEREVVSEYFNK